MGLISDLLGTLRSTFRVGRATIDSSGLTAGRSFVLPDQSGTLAVDRAVVDQTVIASTTLVDTYIYDTSKDSDGGAWRKRCQHTSWYQETIYGTWLGSAANEAAARAVSGAATDDYYYDTTAAKFYALNAGSGVTEVFRGNAREFPARVLITAESTRVVIWDLTQPGCPMWMVFKAVGGGLVSANGVAETNAAAMRNARLLVAVGNVNPGFLNDINFLVDYGFARIDNTNTYNKKAIRDRNVVGADKITGTALAGLVDRRVRDVALTVLPDAPIDPATGLVIPTIDVFTDGGTSRINTDGTVADLVDTAADDHKAGCILASGDSVALNSTNGNVDIYALANTLADTTTPDRAYDQATVPALLEAVDAGDKVAALGNRLAIGQDSGLVHLRENPSASTLGMVAYSTIAYASGWLPGDIRGAWITTADGVTETITGSGELVTNGTFDTDIAGWTNYDPARGATIWSAGRIRLTNAASGTGYTFVTRAVTVVPWKTYTVATDAYNVSTISKRLSVGNSTSTSEYGWVVRTDDGPLSLTFIPTQSTVFVGLLINSPNNNAACEFDNVSVKLVIPDRSVKNNGLVINGSLNKAPVAAGSGLCALSGFSPVNHLTQAYSANLDFGTGDLCAMGWLKEAPNSSEEFILDRYAGTGTLIRASVLSTGYLRFRTYDTTTPHNLDSTRVVDDSVPHFVCFVKAGGVKHLYIDGNLNASATPATNNSLSNATATVGVGIDYAGTANPLTNGSLALWRISATAPSADQIRHIYETEKRLFEPNAQCTIAGSSNAITALAYDDATDLLHVGTSWGRSAFQGLLRVSSEATPVGGIKALAASGGAVAQGGATAADIYVPAYSLREEMERLDDATRALGSRPVFHEFDSVTGQTAFVLPIGWRVVAVYSAGALKRLGATKDYTVADNGFRQTVNFAVAPGDGVWVSIMTVRSN